MPRVHLNDGKAVSGDRPLLISHQLALCFDDFSCLLIIVSTHDYRNSFVLVLLLKRLTDDTRRKMAIAN